MPWILSSGSYSDYHVLGVFPDEPTALRIRAEIAAADAASDYDVDEVPLLEGVIVWMVNHYSAVAVIGWDGTEYKDNGWQDIRVWDDVEVGVPAEQDALTCESIATDHATLPDRKLCVRLQVWGTDVERCRKAFTERRARILADPAVAVIAACTKTAGVFARDRDGFLAASANAGIRDALARAIGEATPAQ